MIKGVHFVSKRLSGGTRRWYVYAWRGGPHVMSADGAKKPKLTQAALAAIAQALRDHIPEATTDPTTLLSLIRTWRSESPDRPSSPERERLAANTKKVWGSALNKIEATWGAVPLALFNDERMIEKVVAWRNSRAHTPRAADMGITVLQALLKFGIHGGRLSRNVAAGIGKLYENGQRAEIIWSDEDLAAFAEAAGDKDAPVNDAIELASVTGLRREDLARLTWAGVGAFAIVRKAKKRSNGRRHFATMRRIPQLNTVLDRLRQIPRAAEDETLLVTNDGQPWNLDTLTKEVTRVAKKAGIAHVDEDTGERKSKHLHDVRGTFATRLMTTTDLTDEEIAGIMGWSPDEVRASAASTLTIGPGRWHWDAASPADCKPDL